MRKKGIYITCILILSSFLLVLLNSFIFSPIQSQNTINSPSQSRFKDQALKLSAPQYIDESLNISSSFQMLESSDDIGIQKNVGSFNINLPSSTWNITDIELNFTSVKLGRQIITIEDYPDRRKLVGWDEQKALSVQVNITEPITIFGAYIYGNRENDPTNKVLFQLRGYDEIPDNIPNETVYASEIINMNTTEMWHLQTFSNPVNLSKGYYSLVINGSALTEFDNTVYYWWNNEKSAHGWLNPNLRIAQHDGSSWSDEGIEKTHLYKLVQRVNKSYNPVEINMAVEIDSNNYTVSNGLKPYTGNVSIQDLDFSPNNEILHIPIKHNQSIELLVNLSYHIYLRNFMSSDGFVLIKENLNNSWTLTPDIKAHFINNSVKFGYPKSWYNLTVWRDNVNITSDPDIKDIGNTLYILNNCISLNSIWKITANSPNVGFTLEVPKTTFEANQNLIFTVNTPGLTGNLTYVLIDALGYEEYNDTAETPPYQNIFSYMISSNPHTGTWIAYVCWNNETDTGIQTQEIIIIKSSDNDNDDSDTVVTGIDPQLIFVIVLIIILSSIAGLTSYQVVRKIKRSKAEYRQRIFNKYNDVLNLDYIIIAEKKSGINVYEQVLAGKKVEVTLVSGFLEAIRNFGLELSGSDEYSQTIKLEYQNMKILMSEFKNFRIINIMKENPSSDFYNALNPLSYDIDRYYGKSLGDFDGEITQFEGIRDLIEDHLNTSLVYPLKAVRSEDIKLDIQERILVKEVLDIMKQKNTNHFYVASLMPEREFNAKKAEIILKLVKKKVFQPLS
ncbi:MAG: hypothetical protein ACFE8A_10300 [Candidatus Hodarchaeota archaeon]